MNYIVKMYFFEDFSFHLYIQFFFYFSNIDQSTILSRDLRRLAPSSIMSIRNWNQKSQVTGQCYSFTYINKVTYCKQAPLIFQFADLHSNTTTTNSCMCDIVVWFRGQIVHIINRDMVSFDRMTHCGGST